MSILLRPARFDDKDSVKLLIYEFYEEGLKEFGLSFDWNTLDNTINEFINKHIHIVAEKENRIVGLIAGVIGTSIFDNKQKLAEETIWFITKEERKGSLAMRLLKAFENECKNKGANFVSMIHMENMNKETLSRLYGINKYRLMEYHYLKII
jgi:hypothetical protein